MSTRAKKAVVLIALIFGGLLSQSVTNANAFLIDHSMYPVGFNGWPFSGRVYSNGTGSGFPGDRVNLIFFGPKLRSNVSASSLVTKYWRDGDNGDMKTDHAALCQSKQYLLFYLYGPNGFDRMGYVKNESALVTDASGCGDQFHIRLWSSKVERQLNPYVAGISRNYWTAGAVHYDDFRPPPYDCEVGSGVLGWATFVGCSLKWEYTDFADECVVHRCHVRIMSFESAEHKAFAELTDNLCGRRDWMALPWSYGNDQGNFEYSDGRVTWISTQRKKWPLLNQGCESSGYNRQTKSLFSPEELAVGAPRFWGN